MDLDHAVCMDSNLSESRLMDVQGEYFQFVMSIAQFLSITKIDLKVLENKPRCEISARPLIAN